MVCLTFLDTFLAVLEYLQAFLYYSLE